MASRSWGPVRLDVQEAKVKYRTGRFHQVSNEAHEKIAAAIRAGAPPTIGWLFGVLCMDEHRFTSSSKNDFYRTIKDLMSDSGMGKMTVNQGLKILNKIGVIKSWQAHFLNPKTGKKSEKHVTAIRFVV